MARGPDPEIDEISILRAFLSDDDPAYTAPEIADRLDVTNEGATHQMNKLVDRGLLEKKKPGPRTVIWWLTDDGIRYYVEHTGAD